MVLVEVDIAPFAVFLNRNEKPMSNRISALYATRASFNDKGCVGAPDWIIEIVSPSSRAMDYLTKLLNYKIAGVREYWIVDPDKNRVTIYRFGIDKVDEYSFTDDIPAGIYPGFH